MKKLLALSLALVMTLSLVACGGGDNADAGTTSDKVVIAMDADYQTLNPANWTTRQERVIDNQIYDTLLTYSYEDPSVLVGKIAKSWEISDDAMCYTFHLNENVTFHDGTPLTAEDIEFSIELTAASAAQGGNVAGYDHCEIIDDHTINVYTSSPFAPFLSNLSLVLIGSKAYYESAGEEAFAQQPIGCGPYKFVSHNEGDKVELVAYDDYYMGAPSIKNITVKIISDQSAMAIGIQTGDINFAEIDAPILATLDGVDGVTVTPANTTTFGFVAMNTEKEPFNNAKFRQAINYALDRQTIIATVVEGAAVENSNLLSADRFGYSDSQKQYTYDVAKAKELLTECGYGDGYDLGTVVVADQYKLLAQVVQDNLAAVGLTCTLEVLEFNAYLNKLRQGDFNLTCLQMTMEGDTQNMAMVVTEEYIGMANNARWHNDQVEEWFQTAVVTVDDAERAAIYNDIFSLVQEEAVYAVLYNPTMLYAHSSNLKIHTLPLEGNFYVYDFSW